MQKSNVKNRMQDLDEELDQKISEIKASEMEDEATQLAKKLGLQYINLHMFPIDTGALFIISEEDSRKGNLAIIAKSGSALTIAVTDPENVNSKEILLSLSEKGYAYTLVIASQDSLTEAWKRYSLHKQSNAQTKGIVDVDETEIDEFSDQIHGLEDFKNKVTSIPTTKILNLILAGALKIEASDIHIEPEETEIRLRYRLDGVLTDVVSFSKNGYDELLSRIKLKSGLKLNIHSSPQDGRFTIRIKGKGDIELRISILPGPYSENIVMRILDPSTIRQKLEDLGMRKDMLELAKKILKKTTGAILTTGPTGSGKTTTLYAFVQHINTPDVKIITIEDPVEYHIKGITQTQVDSGAGYTFADGLRSIVRQDPDTILVGEIRDKETAEICMQASLTGHLVLSTIHTNNAAGTIPRLIDLGIKPVTIAPALHAVMAQRLLRKLCPECKKKEVIHNEDLELLTKYLGNISEKLSLPKVGADTEIYYPVGCKSCNSTGYKGRTGVYEIIEVDDEMQKLILTSPATTQIEELAQGKGLTTLLQDAFIKVLGGITSIEESMRAIGE